MTSNFTQDQELKAKKERMDEIKKKVDDFQKDLVDIYGVKTMIVGWDTKGDRGAMWVSDDVTDLEKLGFSKLVANNF